MAAWPGEQPMPPTPPRPMPPWPPVGDQPTPAPRPVPDGRLITVPLTGCCGELPDHCLCVEFFAELATAPVVWMTAGRAAA